MEIVGQLSKIEMQILYENTYNKKQLKGILRDAFKLVISKEIEALEQAEDEDEKAFGNKFINTLVSVLGILAERQTIYMDSLVAMLYERDMELGEPKGKFVIDVILYAVKEGYVSINKGKNNIQLVSKYQLSEELQKKVDKFKYLNPMLVEPLPVNQRGNNKGSGYLTVGSDSLILGGVYHKETICEDTLNITNKIPFMLDERVIRAYRNEWSNLDKPKDNETSAQYSKRVQAFEHYEKGCYDTFADMINNGNKFWFVNKYDKRGRMYCSGYYTSYQGNSYAKAVLALANQETVQDTIQFFED